MHTCTTYVVEILVKSIEIIKYYYYNYDIYILMTYSKPRPHYYGPRGREIELEFNAKSVRMFDNIMRKDWDYLMQRMYDDLWVSVFLNNFSF